MRENPKFEIRNPKQARITKIGNPKRMFETAVCRSGDSVSVIWVSCFGFVSTIPAKAGFVFRALRFRACRS